MPHPFSSPAPHARRSHRRRVASLLLLSVVVVNGCGERDPVGPLSTIAVDLSSAVVVVDERVQATAKPRDASGHELPATSVTWSSSAPQIAFVSTTGYVMTLAPGTATITATIDGISGGAELTVANSDLRIDI